MKKHSIPASALLLVTAVRAESLSNCRGRLSKVGDDYLMLEIDNGDEVLPVYYPILFDLQNFNTL